MSSKLNEIKRENVQIVMETLSHLNQPCSIAKIINHISADQKLDKKQLKEPVNEILNSGTQQGFVQKIKNMFSLHLLDSPSDAPMKKPRGRPAAKKPEQSNVQQDAVMKKQMTTRKSTNKPAQKRKARSTSKKSKSDEEHQEEPPAKKVSKQKTTRKQMTKKTAPMKRATRKTAPKRKPTKRM